MASTPTIAAAGRNVGLALGRSGCLMSGTFTLDSRSVALDQFRPDALPGVRPEVLSGVGAIARAFDFGPMLLRHGAMAITPEAHGLRSDAEPPRQNCWATSGVDGSSNYRKLGRILIYDLRLIHARHSTVVEVQDLQLCLFVDQQLFNVAPWH